MTEQELDKWLDETAWDKPYWSDVHTIAVALNSDGCSSVPDWMIWTCWEHDGHYRRHKMISGKPITKAQADYIFRRRIQQGSSLGALSPVSWWRWLGVSIFGGSSWDAGGVNRG